jgi:hypothetical protein
MLSNIEEAREKVYIPLSDDDIAKYGVRFVLYSDLSRYETITDLLPNEIDAVIILIRTELSFGHYVALCRHKGNIMFFDSYGFRPDKNFHKTPEYMRDKLGQEYPHLSYMLNDADKFRITFNEYKYQTTSDHSQTCGRWCIWFIRYASRNRKPTINGFAKLVLRESKRYDDIDLNILVCMMVPDSTLLSARVP